MGTPLGATLVGVGEKGLLPGHPKGGNRLLPFVGEQPINERLPISGGTGSVSCNSVFVRYLGRFLNQEELMKPEATVQNP
jgi:hypothetical protein